MGKQNNHQDDLDRIPEKIPENIQSSCECLCYSYGLDEEFREACILSTTSILAECGIAVGRDTAERFTDKMFGEMGERIDVSY